MPASPMVSSFPKEQFMSDRFVVETERQVVGVAVRSPGGFKFF
jgi:hypothetical protein